MCFLAILTCTYLFFIAIMVRVKVMVRFRDIAMTCKDVYAAHTPYCAFIIEGPAY